ncbi:NAD(P)-binding protein [Hyaloscypha variabilis F]|uniref:D-xylose 1-dehydrogenase (NADP(+), D-xylono-1,5-lactone-forming) n=1 Tax=Hyaloscypha variabilis (strain UAMH 11265 / GT02V1 / F) TaxID=1149755 RepID=A0A2J6R2V2_HYAVF|nr:NAD(P)-binding protein [Hyaloscypha variabilis F]
MSSPSCSTLPTLHWGVIGTGLAASWFATDLNLPRANAQARHVIQAIGSSSIEKGETFAKTHLPGVDVTIYNTYEQVYADTKVDIIYIATPATFHKKNCLDAIAAGKHVLCEKPFTITAQESRDVIAAAKAKGVFLMEGMKIFEDKVIGDVNRVLCDLSMYMGQLDQIRSRTAPSENPAIPPGIMLEAGVYPVTWGLLALEKQPGCGEERPQILAASKLCNGVDISTSMIMHYPASGQQAVLSMSMETKLASNFCRIEGTKGHIDVEGLVTSHPESFTIFHKSERPESGIPFAFNKAGQKFKFDQEGWGFHYEADAVALDIAAGRQENAIMPCSETIRVMEIVDEVRRQVGVRFPQDDQ